MDVNKNTILWFLFTTVEADAASWADIFNPNVTEGALRATPAS